MSLALVLSCEHATSHVPAACRAAFAGADEALRSHRGHDIGARQLARDLGRAVGLRPIEATATRLLVDANRSLGHPRLFSEWSRTLPEAARDQAVEQHWRRHRDRVQQEVAAALRGSRSVLHLSVHSFTPCLDGVERDVDVAWLYDPSRAGERRVVDDWRAALAARRPDLRLRRNHPYRGTADGLTTALRRAFPPTRYFGIELEVSQRFPLGDASAWGALRRALVATFVEATR